MGNFQTFKASRIEFEEFSHFGAEKKLFFTSMIS